LKTPQSDMLNHTTDLDKQQLLPVPIVVSGLVAGFYCSGLMSGGDRSWL